MLVENVMSVPLEEVEEDRTTDVIGTPLVAVVVVSEQFSRDEIWLADKYSHIC